MPYVERVKELIADMKQEKKLVDREIRKMPPGRLKIQRRGNYLAYILIDEDGSEHRIGRDEELKQTMTTKEVLIGRSVNLDENIERCRVLRDTLKPTDPVHVIKGLKHGLYRIPIDKYYRKTDNGLLLPRADGNYLIPNPVNDPGIILRQPLTVLKGMTPAEWAAIPYQENTKFHEEKKHLGTNGLYFRSRAEMLLATVYEKNNWPYHYDERLTTEDDIWISPDFQHPNPDCKMFYHEHCELDESDSYDSNFIRKLNIYLSAGIKPGKNLIITWSQKDGSLDLHQIERILKSYYE